MVHKRNKINWGWNIVGRGMRMDVILREKIDIPDDIAARIEVRRGKRSRMYILKGSDGLIKLDDGIEIEVRSETKNRNRGRVPMNYKVGRYYRIDYRGYEI
jgi:hypothetical protein